MFGWALAVLCFSSLFQFGNLTPYPPLLFAAAPDVPVLQLLGRAHSAALHAERGGEEEPVTLCRKCPQALCQAPEPALGGRGQSPSASC